MKNVSRLFDLANTLRVVGFTEFHFQLFSFLLLYSIWSVRIPFRILQTQLVGGVISSFKVDGNEDVEGRRRQRLDSIIGLLICSLCHIMSSRVFSFFLLNCSRRIETSFCSFAFGKVRILNMHEGKLNGDFQVFLIFIVLTFLESYKCD